MVSATRNDLSNLRARSVATVRPGDLVFCTKDSVMQSLLSAVGDPWRHVAVAVPHDGGIGIGEVSGRNRIIVRPLELAIDSYDLVATARVGTAGACVDGAVDWVRSYLDKPQRYAWDDVALAGLILLTRRNLPASRLPALASALTDVAERAPRATHPSMTCSAFVYEAFAQMGDRCVLPIDLGPLSAVSDHEAGPSASVRSRSETPSLSAALDLEPAMRQVVFDGHNLAELVAAEDRRLTADARPSGHRGSRADSAQILRASRIIVAMIDAYARSARTGGDDGISAVGRWVTPGDIWRSSSLVDRASLEPSTGCRTVAGPERG